MSRKLFLALLLGGLAVFSLLLLGFGRPSAEEVVRRCAAVMENVSSLSFKVEAEVWAEQRLSFRIAGALNEPERWAWMSGVISSDNWTSSFEEYVLDNVLYVRRDGWSKLEASWDPRSWKGLVFLAPPLGSRDGGEHWLLELPVGRRVRLPFLELGEKLRVERGLLLVDKERLYLKKVLINASNGVRVEVKITYEDFNKPLEARLPEVIEWKGLSSS